MYKVDILREPQKDIHRLPPDEIPCIIKKIYALKHDPRPFDCKKCKSSVKSVIASRSRSNLVGFVLNPKDCFVAVLLAMTEHYGL